jgi:hypothetical protein
MLKQLPPESDNLREKLEPQSRTAPNVQHATDSDDIKAHLMGALGCGDARRQLPPEKGLRGQ